MSDHPASNAAFIEQHAASGRIGLCGGNQWINKLIRKAQGPLTSDGHRSMWSHAFIFSERRVDGHWWVVESDLDMRTRHVRLGVQENRATRYFDAGEYPNIAILDFGLDAAQVLKVQKKALDTLSGLSTYSLSELVGTLFSLHSRRLRRSENLLSREGALYCSAFVQHCYDAIGIHFQPDVHSKNIAPHDIETSPVPHEVHCLVRDPVIDPKPRRFYRLKKVTA